MVTGSKPKKKGKFCFVYTATTRIFSTVKNLWVFSLTTGLLTFLLFLPIIFFYIVVWGEAGTAELDK